MPKLGTACAMLDTPSPVTSPPWFEATVEPANHTGPTAGLGAVHCTRSSLAPQSGTDAIVLPPSAAASCIAEMC